MLIFLLPKTLFLQNLLLQNSAWANALQVVSEKMTYER